MQIELFPVDVAGELDQQLFLTADLQALRHMADTQAALLLRAASDRRIAWLACGFAAGTTLTTAVSLPQAQPSEARCRHTFLQALGHLLRHVLT